MRSTALPMGVRFWRAVNIAGPGDCWLWTQQTAGSNARYGYFRKGTKSTDPRVPAHRVALELHLGREIPADVEVDHVKTRGCTSKLCCNPAHLEEVTHAENRRRGRLAVCRSGRHTLSDENARFDKLGQRRGCYECYRLGAARRSRERKANAPL